MSVRVQGPEVKSPREVLLSTPVRAAVVCLLLGAAAEWLAPPSWGLSFFRAPQPSLSPEVEATLPPELHEGEAELEAESHSNAAMAAPSNPSLPSGGRPTLFGGQKEAPLPAIAADAPPVALIDPAGTSLDRFFTALARTQRKEPGALTRIAHFGDSIIVSDYVSGPLRRKLQKTFGDSGHGYMLIANPWPSYFHNDVFRYATRGFRVSRIVGPTTADRMYGLGGVTFRAGPGALARFGTAEKGEFGLHVSRFTLSYLSSPGAGQLLLAVDGQEPEVIDTAGDEVQVQRHTVELPDGPHRFELTFRGAESRTFGVVLERDEPGVVLDALGVQGARIRFLGQQDDAHFAEELAWRKPDLIIYQYGANESGDGYAYPMPEYLRTMKEVIEKAQRAVPESSCLIIGAMDRARVENGVTTSMKIIQLIIAEQQKAAEELGCAYFDTYNSMGGWGSMPAWVRRGLGQADMTHPTGVGAERIATWIYGALMQSYDEFLQRSVVP